MNKGTVKWFNNRKGYGFISDDNGNEVYVHHSDINGEGFKTLRPGQNVTFDMGDFNGKEKAINVSVVA